MARVIPRSSLERLLPSRNRGFGGVLGRQRGLSATSVRMGDSNKVGVHALRRAGI